MPTNAIPDAYRDLLSKKTFAHLATVNDDGSPQSTPVWIDYDGTHVLVNSAKGRKKDRNMRERGKVAISMTDPENPYRYLEVRGRVVDVTEKGADAHIDKLAKRYLGADSYPFRRDGEIRVIYKIAPEHATAMG
jgi:PPOX class probable F420-dependent enzyme